MSDQPDDTFLLAYLYLYILLISGLYELHVQINVYTL